MLGPVKWVALRSRTLQMDLTSLHVPIYMPYSSYLPTQIRLFLALHARTGALMRVALSKADYTVTTAPSLHKIM
jgi:hypothetical protein